jgi:pimeloyl-[acyl-carrier protein] methyl ester esterase
MTLIHTETYGTGKPIVLVHGWAMHSGIWRDFAMALAKHYQVTLVDLPGHGLSEPISPFTLETISKALVEAIPYETSCWLGWSLGAEVVLKIAQRYPDRVDKLILLAGTPCFVRQDAWPGMDIKVLDSFADNLNQDSKATLLRFLSLQIKGIDESKPALQTLKHLVFDNPAPDQKTLQEGLIILKQADLRAEFAKLKISVAVILGQLDTLVPVAVAEKLKALLPKIDLTVIDRAGHLPFWAHEEAVIKAITRLMDD